MRLIDADALPKYTGYALSAVEVAKAVENAPTIAASPWRSVEDELPDKNTDVLFYDENGQFHNGVMSRFRGYTEFIDYDGNTLHDITHWMPFPEPPKEVNHESI